MELRNHVIGVSNREAKHNYCGGTVWSLKVDEELYSELRKFLISEVDRLFESVCDKNGNVIGSCPAMGDFDEDFVWVEFGKEGKPVSLLQSEVGGYLEIITNNQPEDELDRLDPNHPDWSRPNPSQWLEALSFFKEVVAKI